MVHRDDSAMDKPWGFQQQQQRQRQWPGRQGTGKRGREERGGGGGMTGRAPHSFLAPFSLMVTRRMQPPLEPSRAMAWETALTTKALQSCSLMLSLQFLSQKP